MDNEGNPPKRDIRFALVFILVLLGGFLLRRAFFAASDFPLHDGGLFYVMIGDLIRNGFQLPLTSSYNAAAIPFLYPPLGLYATGWFETAFGADRLQLFRWITPVAFHGSHPGVLFFGKGSIKG